MFGLVSWTTLDQLSTAVLKGDAESALKIVAELDEGGRDLQRLVQELLGHFRNILVWTHAPELASTFDLTEVQIEGLKTQAKLSDGEKLLRVVEILTEAASQARFALSRRTVVEVALLKAARAATVVSIDELIQQIQAGSAGDDASASSAGTPPSPARVAEPPPTSREPAVPEGDELDHLKRRWPALLGLIGNAAQLAAPCMKEAEPIRIEGDHVILGFDPEFGDHLKRVDTSRTRLVIEKVLSHELRRPIGVTFVLEDRPQAESDPHTQAPPAPPAAKPPGETEGGSRRNLAEDPIVQKTIETFGGAIYDVRE